MPRWTWVAVVAAAAIGMAGQTWAEAAGPYPAEAAAIRALRVENNRALAEHRLDDVMAIAADDYVLAGGDDGLYRSKAQMTGLWRQDFADPKNHGCVRTTDEVEVGVSAGVMRAAETGHWRCTTILPAGEHVGSGKYLAHWTRRSGQWRVVSDNYVTLRCAGAGCEAK